MTDPSGTYARIDITADAALAGSFFLLLQQGVMLRCRAGRSVAAFLRDEIRVEPELFERIQSIMLDGKPVDDIGTALLQDGSTLALSAAMPGLVGATLRRGGAYAAFRSAITYHGTERAAAPGDGWVRLKVYNLLMAELGPRLFRKGVVLETAQLLEFLAEQAQELRQGCAVLLDGKPVDVSHLGDEAGLAGAGRVMLTVTTGPAAG